MALQDRGGRETRRGMTRGEEKLVPSGRVRSATILMAPVVAWVTIWALIRSAPMAAVRE
jgi:hypothetical protein